MHHEYFKNHSHFQYSHKLSYPERTLESENIKCFIYDENMVWVHPFNAVAIGGVKLKVPSDKVEHANNIFKLLAKNRLLDAKGEYNLNNTFNHDYQIQTAKLDIKSKLRKNPELLNTPDELSSSMLSSETIAKLIQDEIEFQNLRKKRLKFTGKQFLYELFDFNRSVFDYLRFRPVEYYIEKELVEKYNSVPKNEKEINCPKCNSKNVSHGYAADQKGDILYLLFSLLLCPLPIIRKKFHCFDCNNEFKTKK